MKDRRSEPGEALVELAAEWLCTMGYAAPSGAYREDVGSLARLLSEVYAEGEAKGRAEEREACAGECRRARGMAISYGCEQGADECERRIRARGGDR